MERKQMIGQRFVKLTATSVFIVAMVAQAQAEVLEFDCFDKAGVFYNIWVDLARSSVTIHYTRPELSRPDRTLPAEIGAASVRWTLGESAKTTLTASIDLATGRYVQVYSGSAQ